jgi:hypothetical protein
MLPKLPNFLNRKKEIKKLIIIDCLGCVYDPSVERCENLPEDMKNLLIVENPNRLIDNQNASMEYYVRAFEYIKELHDEVKPPFALMGTNGEFLSAGLYKPASLTMDSFKTDKSGSISLIDKWKFVREQEKKGLLVTVLTDNYFKYTYNMLRLISGSRVRIVGIERKIIKPEKPFIPFTLTKNLIRYIASI